MTNKLSQEQTLNRDSIKSIKINIIKEFVERIKEYKTIESLSLDGSEIIFIEDIDKVMNEIFNEIQ